MNRFFVLLLPALLLVGCVNYTTNNINGETVNIANRDQTVNNNAGEKQEADGNQPQRNENQLEDNNVSQRQEPSNLTIYVNGVSIEMLYVQHGTLTMGATPEQGDDADSDEEPAHRVTLTNDYYVGKYEVTQKLWKAVMGSNPSYFKGDDLPVEQVSWNDIQEFLKKLNQLTVKNFRLPTEAEWEYAARGGNKSRGYKYSGSNDIGTVAWYDGNSGSKTHPVGTKSPNELGIYDMSGNVWEWCQDWYDSSYYSKSPSTNPTGASSGSNRVDRGGSWYVNARHCRVSGRDYYPPRLRDGSIGFRLAL